MRPFYKVGRRKERRGCYDSRVAASLEELREEIEAWCREHASLWWARVPLLDYFAISVALAWLATSLYGVALYAGDAFQMRLPLLGPGGGHVYHDWNYMLSELELWKWDTRFYALFRLAAGACMIAALAGGGWITWKMFRAAREGTAA